MADQKTLPVLHINRTMFFAAIRHPLFSGTFSQQQVDGLNKILDEQERRKYYEWDAFASMLAQCKLETGHHMWPVREGGGEAYLKGKKYYPWVGEGLIQVTWEANAKKFGAKQPGDLMEWPVALNALFDGMIKGMFTGKKLSDYFHGPENARMQDWANARKIVNPKDYKTFPMVEQMSKLFYQAIIKSLEPGETSFIPSQDIVIPVDPPHVGQQEIVTTPDTPDPEEAVKAAQENFTPPPKPHESLLSRIFANFDLHLFRTPEQNARLVANPPIASIPEKK